MTDPRDERIARRLDEIDALLLTFAERAMDLDCDDLSRDIGFAHVPVAAIRAALTPKPDAAPPSFGVWQPIETAPTDGPAILAWRHDAGVFTAHFVGLEDVTEADWFTTSGEHLPGDERPTHWMPLPAPPKEGERALRGEPTC